MMRYKHVLKGIIALLLLWYVFSSVGWEDIIAELGDLHVGYLLVFLLIGAGQVLVSAWKWQILGTVRGLSLSLSGALVLYLKGMFFSQILPTSVGGDAVRGYELGRANRDLPAAIASVFMERFTGLLVLVIYALVAIPLSPHLIRHDGVAALLGLTFISFVSGAWIVLDERPRRWLQRRFDGRTVGPFIRKAGRLQEAITAYRSHSLHLFGSLGISCLFYAAGVLNLWVGCRVFGTDIPALTLVGAVPLLFLLFLIPISIGGLGLNEWAFTEVLALAGVPPAVGLAVGIIHRGRSVALSLIGGWFYPMEALRSATRNAHPVTESPPAEQEATESTTSRGCER